MSPVTRNPIETRRDSTRELSQNEMPASPNNCDPRMSAASPQAALRERLLTIVGLLPDPAMEAAGAAGMTRARSHGRYSVLLLDKGIDDLRAQRLITTLRKSHPELNVSFLNCGRELKDLPCEFGDGHFHQDDYGGSPIARAAAAHWHRMERAFAVVRAINGFCATRVVMPSGKA
jgi:hypothetical protein